MENLYSTIYIYSRCLLGGTGVTVGVGTPRKQVNIGRSYNITDIIYTSILK